jgi:cell wall assembly regulator SMI1
MRRSVTESIGEIRAWLAAHAPTALGALNPPAEDASLDRAENVVGLDLPDDLRTWWSHMDGVRVPTRGEPLRLIPRSSSPLSVAEALRRRDSWLSIGREFWSTHFDVDERIAEGARSPAGSAFPIWLPQWIPIASDPGTETLFVDLRSGDQKGAVMAFDRVDGGLHPPRWDNVPDMLDEIAWRLVETDLDLPDDPWIEGILDWPTAGTEM